MNLMRDRPVALRAFVLLILLLGLAGVFSVALRVDYVRRYVARRQFLLLHPKASTAEKLRYELGDSYRIAELIQSATPDDSVILMPPKEAPHVNCADRGWRYYFAWPRYLTKESDNASPPIDYAMIVGGAVSPSVAQMVEDDAIPNGAWGLYDLKRRMFIPLEE